MSIKTIIFLLGFVILMGVFTNIKIEINDKDKINVSDYKTYNTVKDKLDEKCKFVIDTVSILFPSDLRFGRRSRFVSYDTKKFPGYITIWYTKDSAIYQKSLEEGDFFMFVLPSEKLISDKETLMGWIEEKHRRNELLNIIKR